MGKRDKELMNELLQNHFEFFVERAFKQLNPGGPFLPNWHLRAIGYQLQRVLRGEVTRLIINMPPRNLKSTLASVAFPAFLLGHQPERRIFTISYGSELAEKHSSDFRAVVEAPYYRAAFPNMRIARSLAEEVYTTRRGFRKSTSVGGTLTGLGGDIFIIDDPLKPVDAMSDSRRNFVNQWFTNTLMSRLDNKETGVIILVMQRLHMDDLAGYLMNASDEWTLLSLPAIAEVEERIQVGDSDFHIRHAGEALHEKRESLATLEKIRRELGSDIFSAQYQQMPVPVGGVMIQRGWLRYYVPDKLPPRTYRAKIIQSWDTAGKLGPQNDWSVCTTWLFVDDHFYLLEVTRSRFDYPTLSRTAVELAKRFEPDFVLIEDASSGIALAQELEGLVKWPITPVPVERDKIGRLYVQQAKFAAGRVHFLKGAPFLPILEAELLSFPNGKTDDIVDSISQALACEPCGYDTTMSWVG